MIDWEPVREFWRNNPALDWNELEATVKAANVGGELWGVNTILDGVDIIGQPDGSIRIQPPARLGLLEEFFRRVSVLTVDHDVLDDNAVVYPSKLGPLLEKVDPQWYKIKGSSALKGSSAPSAELYWTDREGAHHSMPIDAAVDELRRLYEAAPGGVGQLIRAAARKRIGAVSFDADGGACLHPDYKGGLGELCRTLDAGATGGPHTAAWAFVDGEEADEHTVMTFDVRRYPEMDSWAVFGPDGSGICVAGETVEAALVSAVAAWRYLAAVAPGQVPPFNGD